MFYSIYCKASIGSHPVKMNSSKMSHEEASSRLRQEADEYKANGFEIQWHAGDAEQFSAIDLRCPSPIHRFLFIAPD